MHKILFLWFMLFALGTKAQTMTTIIQNMPDSILPQLTRNNRLDFVDYLASNMKAETTNRLGGKSEMTELSDTYTYIRLSKSAEVAFKLLTTDTGNKIIMQINTYTLPDSFKVSHPVFYTSDWQIIPSKTLLPGNIFHVGQDTAIQLTAYADNSDIDVFRHKVVTIEPYDDKGEEGKQDVLHLQWNGKTF